MVPAALDGSSTAKISAAAVLTIPWAVDEHVANADLRRWLEHDSPGVAASCVAGLSRRGDWDWMAAKGMSLPSLKKMLILKALASGESGNLRNPGSDEESAFWKHCATDFPLMTVDALYSIGLKTSGENGFDMTLHDPLRDFLSKEAELIEANPAAVANEKHGEPVAKLVRFVGAWKRPEDVPLFRRLLKHPMYAKLTLMDSEKRKFEQRWFSVRAAAKSALQSMGGSVGDDVILGEKIPLPPE
jgi:hypothetical protein